jgi:hypothetical protein
MLKNKSILEIGIGLGNCAKEFIKHTNNYHCCDISQSALDKVKNYAKSTFLTHELKNAEPVDLAICHLVFVHCADDEVLRIINDVNLTENGQLMFQISCFAEDYTVNKRVHSDLIENGSHFFRNMELVKSIIDSSNKEVISITDAWDPGSYLDYDLRQSWHFVTLVNKKK